MVFIFGILLRNDVEYVWVGDDWIVGEVDVL